MTVLAENPLLAEVERARHEAVICAMAYAMAIDGHREREEVERAAAYVEHAGRRLNAAHAAYTAEHRLQNAVDRSLR